MNNKVYASLFLMFSLGCGIANAIEVIDHDPSLGAEERRAQNFLLYVPDRDVALNIHTICTIYKSDIEKWREEYGVYGKKEKEISALWRRLNRLKKKHNAKVTFLFPSNGVNRPKLLIKIKSEKKAPAADVFQECQKGSVTKLHCGSGAVAKELERLQWKLF